MSTIVNRVAKGSKLTFAEVDSNFSNLNNDKAQMFHGDSAPSSPTVGDFWFNTTTLTTFVYYNSQWVQSVVASGGNATGGGGISLTDLSVGSEASASGDGGIAYNNGTGVFTYTPPVISATTVVSSSANLPSSPNDGDLAYATDTSRLYLARSNGWYSVALVNTAPTLSGNSATYELATNGSATVVTMTATDAEGDPITWSHTTSGLGSIATVSRTNNVFTITPSTNQSNAGSFTISFTANDTVNTATSTSTFTLTFANPIHRSIALSAKTSGTNNRTNSSFVDSSSSSHSVSAYGEVYQSTFSPFLDYSYYFDGNDSLTLPASHADFTFGTGAFTLEAYFKPNASSGASNFITGLGAIGDFGWDSNIAPEAGSISTSGIGASLDKNKSEWHHVAYVRSGSTFTIYLDGQAIESASNSTDVTAGTPVIANNFTGHLSNIRIVKGSAVYTANFKPSYEKLTAISGTVFLLNSNRFVDTSSNAHAITVGGDPKVRSDIPLTIADDFSSSNGGSAYFDGNGDYLNVADHADFDLSGSWTFETWVYPTNLGSGFNPIFQVGADSSNGFVLDCSSGGSTPRFLYYAGSWVNFSSSTTIRNNEWSHLSVTWDGSTYRLFVNGVVTASASSSTAITNPTTVVQVGRSTTSGGAQRYFTGWIADTHFVKGTAKYTSAFTPPTSLLDNHTNTKLKLNYGQIGIFDLSNKNSLALFGDVKESTTQTKFATTSMRFDGTGDYIVSENDIFKVGKGDWQFEAWVRWDGTTGGIFHVTAASIGTGNQTNSNTFGLGVSSGSTWLLYHNGQTNTSTSVTADTWYHVVYLRRSGLRKFYVNGSEIHSATDTTDYSTTDTFNLGGYYSTSYLWHGYIEDARFLTGHTTYPNTRPTIAATAITNTKLLTCNSSSIADSSSSSHTLTNNGTVAATTFSPPTSTVTHSYSFNGNGQYLSTPSSSDFSFGTGDYAISFFLYTPSANTANATGNIIDFRNGSSGFNFYITNSGALHYGNEAGGSGTGSINISFHRWYYVSVNRQSGTLTYSIDGIPIASGSNSNNIGTTGGRIGNRWSGSNQYFHGYISDLRIIKGSGNSFGASFTAPGGAL